jgi:hypothetical protein
MSQTKSEATRVAMPDVNFVQDNFGKAMEAPKKFMETQLQTSSALLNFASQRMLAQAEFLGRVSHCTSFEEAAKMQAKFFESMMSDYSREMAHLTELARSNAVIATQAVKEATKAERSA